MSHQPTTSPISCWINVARLPSKGTPVRIEATEQQRADLALAHDLLEVRSLQVDMLVVPWKRNGVRVAGTVSAAVVQACVVTLEPVEGIVDETFEQVFLPHDSKLGRLGFDGGGEILLDAEGDDSPETFEGDSLDVGALAEQFFGLAIDPYPRKPGAQLPASVEQDDATPPDDDWRGKLGKLLDKK